MASCQPDLHRLEAPFEGAGPAWEPLQEKLEDMRSVVNALVDEITHMSSGTGSLPAGNTIRMFSTIADASTGFIRVARISINGAVIDGIIEDDATLLLPESQSQL